MKLAFFLAMDEQHGIGYQNQLPWHMPADLKYFKKFTLGKPILMGRKTFASIGKPLPGRENIVITRDPTYRALGCTVYHSPKLALAALQAHQEVMLIGGAELFTQLLPQAELIYLTRIHAVFTADVYFPAWNENEWQLVSEEKHQPDSKNPYPYTFMTYQRL